MSDSTCPGCGEQFRPKRKEQRACSRSCANRRFRDRDCAVCGASFRPLTARQETCGKSCAAIKSHRDHPRSATPDQSKLNSPEARAKKAAKVRGINNPMHGRVGALNPAFRNGKYAGVKYYRTKTGTKCADCGSKSDLLVHHHDRDRSNNADDNLVTLCRSCHTKRHIRAGDIPGFTSPGPA